MTGNRGIVYTFYSFKGGVGRSMALANVASLLSKGQYKVLIIDWDLEAPGLEKYFSNPPSSLSGSRSEIPGILDIIHGYLDKEPLDWHNCMLHANPFGNGQAISILSAGKESADYVSRLQNINWELLFNESGFGLYLEQIREEWITEFDFILVDSRTGITDIGGICTIHLPDVLVLLFSANEQSLAGIIDVTLRAKEKYKSLPFDRSKLLAVPVPSRFENITEYKMANTWKSIFAQRLSFIYTDWLPDKITATDALEKLFIPYVPFWSFGEGLPVVEEGISDPRTLGFAYNFLAKLLANRLNWQDSLQGDFSLINEISAERINQWADLTYDSLSEYEKKIAKNILLRFTQLDRTNDIDDIARKMKQTEFSLFENKIVKTLIKVKILVRNIDNVSKEPVIELVQSSLIKNWLRYRTWITENRDFLIWRQNLDLKILEWEENDYSKKFLGQGEILKKAKKFLKSRKDELNETEEIFALSSIREQHLGKYKKISLYLIGSIVVLICLYFLLQW